MILITSKERLIIEKPVQFGSGVSDKSADVRYDKWSPDFLADYIVNNHHSYVINAIPVIEQHLSLN